MRVAFIGHAYHQKTGSSRFLIDLLERHATVEQWYGEPGAAATRKWSSGFDEARYDVIVIWQLFEAFYLLSGRHPNVVFVPMYDAMFWGRNFYWKPCFNAAKIVCFSWALRQKIMGLGGVHAAFQYFPDPARHTPVEDFTTLRGLLWYRRREMPPKLAFGLCRGTAFEHFVLHDAPDPGNEAEDAWHAPPNIRQLRRTSWSTDGSAYASALRDSNVFFAPRPLEGIGMSVLEAMADGLCVVAPDAPTMNEYISNGTNGLLFNPHRPSRLDFSDAHRIGQRARETIERGYERWQTSIPTLLDFIATPTAALRNATQTTIPVSNRFTPVPVRSQPDRPLVSVVTVCRNAAAGLEATMQSVLAQTGCEFEYVVVDGQSTDGSLDIIRKYAERLAAWHSAPDDGPYDAMNAAVKLARGTWVLFMNADDCFVSEDALQRMFALAPADADVIYGHHIYRREDGVEELRRAASFETTWSRLRSGNLSHDWLAGIPSHQSTAIRRDLLARLRFDTGYRIAADHDLLFRARGQGACFFNCDEVVAIYRAGGLSTRQFELCRNEWLAVARTHGDAAAAEWFFAHLEVVSASHITRLAQFVLRLITVTERYSTTLARVVERIARSSAARDLARRVLPNAPATRFDLDSF